MQCNKLLGLGAADTCRKTGYTGDTNLLEARFEVSSSDSHCNPAAVFLGCSLAGGSSDGKATQGDENIFSMGLSFQGVVNASETLPCLSFAESTGLVGYHHEF